MIKWYWGFPLTTRTPNAPGFYGVRIGRLLIGKLGKNLLAVGDP